MTLEPLKTMGSLILYSPSPKKLFMWFLVWVKS